jgi:cyclic beta-1,2-glucan synthetase
VLDNGPWSTWKDRPSGVYLLRGNRMTEAERTLLASVARAVLSGNRGTLANQIDRPYPERQKVERPYPEPRKVEREKFSSRSRGPSAPSVAQTEVEIPQRILGNGLGGFSADGREYVVVLEGARETPLPWANVIANPAFGTIVTASGSAFTWAENSRENRLTPFANDPSPIPARSACSSATTTRERRGRQRQVPCSGVARAVAS